MDAYSFGKYITNSRGVYKALSGVSSIYSGQGFANAALFAGGALSPIGPTVATGLAIATTLYGAKSIYEAFQ
jgi:hypothetical protein